MSFTLFALRRPLDSSASSSRNRFMTAGARPPACRMYSSSASMRAGSNSNPCPHAAAWWIPWIIAPSRMLAFASARMLSRIAPPSHPGGIHAPAWRHISVIVASSHASDHVPSSSPSNSSYARSSSSPSDSSSGSSGSGSPSAVPGAPSSAFTGSLAPGVSAVARVPDPCALVVLFRLSVRGAGFLCGEDLRGSPPAFPSSRVCLCGLGARRPFPPALVASTAGTGASSRVLLISVSSSLPCSRFRGPRASVGGSWPLSSPPSVSLSPRSSRSFPVPVCLSSPSPAFFLFLWEARGVVPTAPPPPPQSQLGSNSVPNILDRIAFVEAAACHLCHVASVTRFHASAFVPVCL